MVCLFVSAKPIPEPDPKPADEPHDGVFKINITASHEGCIHVKPFEQIVYPQVDYINSAVCKTIKNRWRFDTYNRISIGYYSDIQYSMLTNYCLSEDLEVKNGKWVLAGGESWNYVKLLPCLIDDPRQQWRYEQDRLNPNNDKLVNIASGHKLGYAKWTLATADKFDKYLYSFTVPREQKWLKTIAEPRDFSVTLALKWFWNGKYKSIWGYSYGTLRYNPETSQISRSDKRDLWCLTSKLVGKPETEHWNWTSWEICGDEYLDGEKVPKNQQWTIHSVHSPSSSTAAAIKANYVVTVNDADGNLLRIKPIGNNWGEPYTYRLKYLEKDKPTIEYAATSVFFEDGQYNNWETLAVGDALQTLKYCPAPGIKPEKCYKKKSVRTPANHNTLLPGDFELTLAWIARIYAIVNSPDSSSSSLGICGTCMFQATELLLNFMRFGSGGVPSATDRGLLWKNYNVAGLDQFQSKSPAIFQVVNQQYENIVRIGITRNAWLGFPVYDVANNIAFLDQAMRGAIDLFISGANLGMVLTEALRPPQSRPVVAPYISSTLIQADTTLAFQRLFVEPVGTVWLVSTSTGEETSTRYMTSGHAFIMVRYTDGIGVMNTNVNDHWTQDEYRDQVLSPRVTTPQQLFTLLSNQDIFFPGMLSSAFYGLDFYRIDRMDTSTYVESTTTRQHCKNDTQGGAGGTGSGHYSAAPSGVTQCGTGIRCANFLYKSN